MVNPDDQKTAAVQRAMRWQAVFLRRHRAETGAADAAAAGASTSKARLRVISHRVTIRAVNKQGPVRGGRVTVRVTGEVSFERSARGGKPGRGYRKLLPFTGILASSQRSVVL